jgi:hypothetical protein
MAALRWFAGVSLVTVGIGAVFVWLAKHQIESRYRPA